MKQNSNKNRSNGRHGRFNNNRRQNNVITRNTPFDSSSPAGRIRGTSQQLVEKYMSLAKDAKNQDDRVLYETYLQYADHYARMLAMAIANEQQQKIQIQSQSVQNTATNAENAASEQAIADENNAPEAAKTQIPGAEASIQVNADTAISDAKQQAQEDAENKAEKLKAQRRVRKVAVKKEKPAEAKDAEPKEQAVKAEETAE